MFGMTRGELGLVAFIFLLVWSAQILPRVGDAVGRLLFGRASGPVPGAAPTDKDG